MEIYSVAIIITFISSIVLGLFVLAKNRRAKINRLLGLIMFSIALWNGALFFFQVGLSDNIIWLIIFMPLGLLFIVYAILNPRPIEPELVIRKIIIFSMMVVLIMALFILGIFIGQKVLKYFLEINPWLINLLGIVLVVINFRIIKSFVVKIVDSTIFKARYTKQKILADASRAIISIIDLNQLLKLFFDAVNEAIQAKDIKLFILGPNKQKFINRTPLSLTKKGDNILAINRSSALGFFLTKHKKPVIFKELADRINNIESDTIEKREFEQVRDDLKTIGAMICVPLFYQKEIVALLNLGPKFNKAPFTSTEISLLVGLASQTAMAIKNSQTVASLERAKQGFEKLNKELDFKVKNKTKELQKLTKELEEAVKNRTRELRKRIQELERFYKLTIGRELKMIELKKEIAKLKTLKVE